MLTRGVSPVAGARIVVPVSIDVVAGVSAVSADAVAMATALTSAAYLRTLCRVVPCARGPKLLFACLRTPRRSSSCFIDAARSLVRSTVLPVRAHGREGDFFFFC